MVGPWQVPVADCAVTAAGYDGYTGEAMAMGERTPAAVNNAAASARLAVGEALTNLAAAQIGELGSVNLSANWMAAPAVPGEAADLYAAVHAVGMELCPALGITIPVGKDSMSMSTVWPEGGADRRVTSPVSLIVSAFAPVSDIRLTLTPQLQAVGGSILAQVFLQTGEAPPDVDRPEDLRGFWGAIQQLSREGLLLAYHDRSDGGLLVTVIEMAFAGRRGVVLDRPAAARDPFAALFAEELGAVVQIRADQRSRVHAILAAHGVADCTRLLGRTTAAPQITVRQNGAELWSEDLFVLRDLWSDVTRRLAGMRDNPACAESEHGLRLEREDPGLSPVVPFTVSVGRDLTGRPPLAILREQGVNGEVEMAAAFHRAGFAPVDVHMSDILAGRVSLRDFRGLAACGGFSYGDVLGAGEGWAKSILFNERARAEFAAFFARADTFALGVCNGCQMMSNLREIIPGAAEWPRFVQNESERYESRYVSVRIERSPSLLFAGMEGAVLPVAVAHGEGRAEFADAAAAEAFSTSGLVAARFVDNHYRVTQRYPLNPNGSPAGMTALTSRDGRVTILMPHPERVFRSACLSWAPRGWGEDSPWMRLFRNGRQWVG